MIGTRLLALVPVAALVAVGLAATPTAAAPGAPAAPAAATAKPSHKLTTVELHGDYSYNTGTRDSQHFCGQTRKYTIHYAETATTTDANLDNNKRVHWHFTKLTGTSGLKPDASPACTTDPGALPPPCTAPLHLRPGWEDSNSGAVNISGFNFNEDLTFNDYLIAGYPPYFGLTTESTCGDVKGRYSNPNGADGGPYVIRIEDAKAGHTKVTHKGQNIDKVTPGSDGTSFYHVHAHATLTIKAGYDGNPPKDDSKAREARKKAKDAAKADLPAAFENAKGPCLNYALGLGLFGGGTLLIGTPAIGPTLTVAGSLTALAAEPFCVATLERIAKDIKIYNDPPDRRYHQIARPGRVAGVKLPACKEKDADAQAFCVKVRPALIDWVAKAQTIASIDNALSTTTNRLTGAIKHHNKKGQKTQSKQSNKLVAKLKKAKAALKLSGATLAGIYHNAGLSMPISKHRAKQAVGYVIKRLRKEHVTAKTVRKVSNKLLSTAAYDGLAALAAG